MSERDRILRSLRRQAETIIELVDTDSPDLLLALTTNQLWDAAAALFGEELYKERGKRDQVWARHGHGICQDCDREIAPIRTHPNVCEHCDAKREEDYQEIERQLREEG